MKFKDYESEHIRLYREFCHTVRDILEKAIAAAGLPRPQSMQCREKDPKKLKTRLEEQGALESDSIETLRRDLAGARIIFYTNTDVDRFIGSQLISKNFEVEEDGIKIHHPMKENNEHQYRGIHYTIRLKDDRTSLAGFLAAILAGLHESGDGRTYEDETERVLRDGKHLAALVRHLRLKKTPNVELAIRTLQRAMEVQHDIAVAECLIMAMEVRSESLPPKEEFFEPAIGYFNRKHEYWWVRAAWMAGETSFFASLSKDQASLLMPAMVHASKVEYQVEQILIQIAKHYPALVWECFAARLAIKEEEAPERYEAIPYQFHGLQEELSKDAKLAVELLRASDVLFNRPD